MEKALFIEITVNNFLELECMKPKIQEAQRLLSQSTGKGFSRICFNEEEENNSKRKVWGTKKKKKDKEFGIHLKKNELSDWQKFQSLKFSLWCCGEQALSCITGRKKWQNHYGGKLAILAKCPIHLLWISGIISRKNIPKITWQKKKKKAPGYWQYYFYNSKRVQTKQMSESMGPQLNKL